MNAHDDLCPVATVYDAMGERPKSTAQLSSGTRVDVLATIRAHAESHRSLAASDAYSAQEAPKLEATLAAVAELVAAASAIDRLRHLDEASDAERKRLTAALAALSEVGR